MHSQELGRYLAKTKEQFGYTLADLGNLLRQAREEKGLTYQELEKRTNIWSRNFRDMDGGNFRFADEEFYRVSFLKQYAEQLDLNAKEVVAKYKACYSYAHPETKNDISRMATVKGGFLGAVFNAIKVFLITN